ncbi:MAG: DNA endonuclease SmrA [Pseudomonadales bacterium]|jgi:DNA-nicking Smr family endonuclease|nr:DNA endonuclease SmrA [Pseudomonadales bacterium]
MKEDDELSEEALFLAAMRDVAPVGKGRKQEQRVSVQDSPGRRQRREDAMGVGKDAVDPNFLTLAEVPLVEPLAPVEWKKDGVQNAVFKKLQQGGYPIEAALDLHRKTVKEARVLLFNFIATMSARDRRSGLISPGKGEFSETPGRLKSFAVHWLQEHPEIIAFCSAQKQHGGVGSIYLLVRKSQASSELNRELHEKG